MHYLAQQLRDMAEEFSSDRNYVTPERREDFRSRLIDTMHWSADALDRYMRDGQKFNDLVGKLDELEGLGLDARTLNCLRNDRLVTILQLARVSDADLMRTPNFGRKSLARLRARVPYCPEGKPRIRVQAIAGRA